MDELQLVKETLERFEAYPGGMCIHHRKATVYWVSRYLLGELNDRKLLPCTVERAVDQTFKEGWFIRLFYKESIACLIYVEALALKDEKLFPGRKYAEWIKSIENHRAEAAEHSKILDQRKQMLEEGKQKAIAELIPPDLKTWLMGYPQDGILINTRNFHMRIKPGVQCMVELGKRHYNFRSEVTGKMESVGANYYVDAKVLEVSNDKVKVEAHGVELTVERYRITKVRRSN